MPFLPSNFDIAPTCEFCTKGESFSVTCRILVQLRSLISQVTQTFDMKLPQQAFSMLCSLTHLQQQAGSLLIISASLKFILGIEIAEAN